MLLVAPALYHSLVLPSLAFSLFIPFKSVLLSSGPLQVAAACVTTTSAIVDSAGTRFWSPGDSRRTKFGKAKPSQADNFPKAIRKAFGKLSRVSKAVSSFVCPLPEQLLSLLELLLLHPPFGCQTTVERANRYLPPEWALNVALE